MFRFVQIRHENPKIRINMALGDENPEIHDARTASDVKTVNGIGFYGV